MVTKPEFELCRSWAKLCMFLFTIVLSIALYLTRLAKRGDKVHVDDEDFWANVKGGIIIVSYVVSVGNSLYEKRGKILNWYKFGMLSILLLIDVKLYKAATMAAGDNVPTTWKDFFADKHLVWFAASCIVSGLSSLVNVKGNEREVPVLEDHDMELGLLRNSTAYPNTTQEFQEALADRDYCKENLIDMIMDHQRTNKRLIQDNEIIMSWVHRADCE